MEMSDSELRYEICCDIKLYYFLSIIISETVKIKKLTKINVLISLPFLNGMVI